MINIGLIGAGRWGKNYIKTLNNIGEAKLSIIYDTKSAFELTEQLCDFLPPEVKILGGDMGKLRGIDAVIIASPTSTHAEYIERCLNLGIKYILCEKPMCTSKPEAARLVANIKEYENANVFVGHTYLFNNHLNEAIQLVKSGEIGRLCYVSSERLNFGPVRYDMNAVSDLAVHDISVFNNMFEKTPDMIMGYGYDVMKRGIEDIVNIHMSYCGIPVHVKAGWLYPEKVREVSFVGTDGMVFFNELGETVVTHHHKKLEKISDNRYNEEDLGSSGVAASNKMPLTEELEFFIDAVKNKDSIDNIDFSYGVMCTIDEINESIKKGVCLKDG